MAISRKDPKGRKLREGENWRNDGRYSYRYTDVRTGKRLTVYAQDLPELREKEKQIAKDMEDNILTDGAIKKMTLNTLWYDSCFRNRNSSLCRDMYLLHVNRICGFL